VDVEPGNEWFVTGAADRVIKVCKTIFIVLKNRNKRFIF
jgi:hypothetical protein